MADGIDRPHETIALPREGGKAGILPDDRKTGSLVRRYTN